MSAAIPLSWPLVVCLAVVWVGVALHAGLSMRRYRRRWWMWFVLSVFLTVIPAVVCSYVEYFRELRRQRRAFGAGGSRRAPPGSGSVQPGQVRRCRHCGALLGGAAGDPASPAADPAPDKPPEPAGRNTCPHCGMAVENEYLA